jgi:hypothetical protein
MTSGTPARAWTEEEAAFVRANWSTMHDKDMAAHLNRTMASVARWRSGHGITGRDFYLVAATPRPSKPKGFSSAQITWAEQFPDDPEAKLIRCMLDHPVEVAGGSF